MRNQELEELEELEELDSMDSNTSAAQVALNGTLESNGTEYEHWAQATTYIVPVLFIIIFFTGFVGNGTLIIIFIRHRSMRSIPNTYILSLAVGDLLVVTVSVPFVSTIYTFESWPFGPIVCQVSEFFRDISSAVTIYTLVALSIERYTVVVNNLRARLSGSKRTSTLITTVFIWLMAITMSIPSVLFSDSVDFLAGSNETNETLFICYPFPVDKWPWYPRIIIMTRFILLYVIPLIIIAPFYITLSKYLLISTQHSIGEGVPIRRAMSCQLTLGHSRQLKARKKIAVLVLAMFFLFLISFLPNHVFMIWFYYNSNSKNEYNDFWHYFRIVGFVLMFANSCMNPIALYCLSAAFRKHFNYYIFYCCSKKKRQASRSNSSPYRHNVRNHIEYGRGSSQAPKQAVEATATSQLVYL